MRVCVRFVRWMRSEELTSTICTTDQRVDRCWFGKSGPKEKLRVWWIDLCELRFPPGNKHGYLVAPGQFKIGFSNQVSGTNVLIYKVYDDPFNPLIKALSDYFFVLVHITSTSVSGFFPCDWVIKCRGGRQITRTPSACWISD